MKPYLSFLASLLFLFIEALSPLRAQSDYGKVSPMTADFIRHGNIPVSLYTGQVSLSIPLYQIKDSDFDIPLVLNYSADGYNPSKRAGWIGLNWSLGGIGAITRDVYGVPDDFTDYHTAGAVPEYSIGFWQAVQLRPYTWEQFYDTDPEITIERDTYFDLPLLNSKSYDCQPDMFMFSMPGHNGTFVADNQGIIRTNHRGYKVDLSGLAAQNTDASNLNDSQIKIISPDGYIYIFGGTQNSIEYSMAFHPLETYTEQKKKKQITAWHLTSITAPNGRQVIFNYKTHDYLDGSSPFLLPIHARLQTTGNQHINNYSYQATKTIFLESIVIADTGVRIDFNQSIENCDKFYEEDFIMYNAKSYQLDSIQVKQNSSTKYTYRFAYENRQRMRFLKQVAMHDDGVYTFNYHHPPIYPDPKMIPLNLINKLGYYTVISTYDKDVSDYFSYNDSIDALLKDRSSIVDSLLCVVRQVNLANSTFKNIGVWCDTYVILSTYMNMRGFFSVEEVLWEIPCTKRIIQSYFNSPLQDWGSLSEEQIYSLPHKICNLMCTIPDKDRIVFYTTFFDKIESKMANDGD
jgi:hypothetical protein